MKTVAFALKYLSKNKCAKSWCKFFALLLLFSWALTNLLYSPPYVILITAP